MTEASFNKLVDILYLGVSELTSKDRTRARASLLHLEDFNGLEKMT
jgi:hypothetical protein